MIGIRKRGLVYRNWLLILLTLFFCSPVNAQGKGRELHYGEVLEHESTYDPIYRSTELAYRIGMMVFNGLLTFDRENNPIPQLTSLTKDELRAYTPKNSVIYHFPLRHDVQWQDGKRFSAYDVLFTYLAMKNSSTTKDQVNFIAEAKVLDEYMIQFTLKAPVRNALGRLVFHIIPHHPFVPNRQDINPYNPDCKVPRQHEFVIKPIGTGPYRFDSTREREVHLLVNENYPMLPDGRTRSYIDKIIMQPFTEARLLSLALVFGGIDLALEIPSTRVNEITHAASNEGRNLWTQWYQSLTYYFFALNHDHPFLGGNENQTVRQAIHYATNRKQWVEEFGNGAGVLVSGPFPIDSPFADVTVQPYEYNVEKAKDLLRDAGFADTNGDGILEKGGKSFQIILKQVAGSLENDRICNAFANALREIGIKVKIQTIADREEWVQQVYYHHDFDVILDGWSFSTATGLYPLFHSSQSFPGGKNYIRYSNAAVDSTLELFQKELEPTALMHLGREMHRMLHEDCPYIFLWTPLRVTVGDAKIKNVQIHPDGFFNYITEWWIEPSPTLVPKQLISATPIPPPRWLQEPDLESDQQYLAFKGTSLDTDHLKDAEHLAYQDARVAIEGYLFTHVSSRFILVFHLICHLPNLLFRCNFPKCFSKKFCVLYREVQRRYPQALVFINPHK